MISITNFTKKMNIKMHIMKKIILFLISVFIYLGLYNASGVCQNIKSEVKERIPQNTKGIEIEEVLKESLNNPETVSKVVNSVINRDNGYSFLKDLDIEFKTFTSSENESIKGIGLSYSYSKDKRFFNDDNAKQSNLFGFDLSFSSKGNISFNSDINPADFLKTNLKFHIFNSSGGVINTKDTNYENDIKDVKHFLEHELTKMSDPWKSKEWKQYFGLIQEYLSNQYYIDFSFLGSFESNQKFTSKNYTFGAQLGLDVKAWNNNNILAKMNIFDWPFSLIRYLNNTDSKPTPKGSTIPTVLLTFERIEPVGNDPRIPLGEKSQFNRFSTEIAFRTIIISTNKLKGYFETDFRFYKELNPPEIIKTNKLEQFLYFVCAIKLSNGLFVSYSNGQLPFDRQKDKVYAIGFDFHL
jgi:hypothetical protein